MVYLSKSLVLLFFFSLLHLEYAQWSFQRLPTVESGKMPERMVLKKANKNSKFFVYNLFDIG